MYPVTYFERISIVYWRKSILFYLLTCFLSLFPHRTEHGFITWNVIYRICEEHTQESHSSSHQGIVQFYHHFWQCRIQQSGLKMCHFMSWVRSRPKMVHKQRPPPTPPPPPPQTQCSNEVIKSIHVGQFGSFFVYNRMFMKIIHDGYSSSHANLWDITSKSVISAATNKEGFFGR